jgi:hypothetical protein
MWITGHDVFGMKRNGTGDKFIILGVIFYPIPLLWSIYEKGIQTFLKRIDEPLEKVFPIKLKTTQDIKIFFKDRPGNAQNQLPREPMVNDPARIPSEKR